MASSVTSAPASPSVNFNTIGTWQADSVTANQVEAELSALRRHEERAAVRTSVLTLVIVVSSKDEATETLDVVRHLGARHPSRTLVLVLDDDEERETRLDASVAVYAIEREGRQVCVEEVTLEVRGKARHHLDSLVLPFTLADLPVAVWLPKSLPSRGDPLLEAAHRVIVDTRVVGYRADSLSRLSALTHRVAVTDLSWWRLKPWRNMLGSLFEGRIYRPFLRDVHSLQVTGHAGPRHLIAGWLMGRLDLPRPIVHLGDAEHLSVKLVATHDGRRGQFGVERKGDERVIDASVEIEGGPSFQQKVRIGEDWPSRSLADALAHMGHNQTYEAALHAALGLLK
jgi:glucose-6-phosphate dehydrogenase assembly protein OpcA